MAEKRLRISQILSKREPAYWSKRLFRNEYVYKGKRASVRSWSVKIQVFGRRKSFTLDSSERVRAADEACRIYQTILEQGWEAVIQNGAAAGLRSPGALGRGAVWTFVPQDTEYWKQRLIHRKYPEPNQPRQAPELSVWIEHGRSSQCFPLGTSNTAEAASLAMHIYQTVVTRGWASARAQFPRELSLALRWQDNPLAWTYTTIHTRPSGVPVDQPDRPEGQHVILIEPDEGIRFALAASVNSQEGFRCDTMFAGAAEALAEIRRRPADLLLVNHDLPDEPGVTFVRPGLNVLSYSVFPESDQLFKSTPGGAVVYMLKRTPPGRILEPIAGLLRPATREQIASHVREYFQHLSSLLPPGPPLWKLAKLTPREHEILAFLSKGALAKEIAEALGISNWTVHGHMKRIFEKLKVHTRTEAVIKYLQK